MFKIIQLKTISKQYYLIPVFIKKYVCIGKYPVNINDSCKI